MYPKGKTFLFKWRQKVLVFFHKNRPVTMAQPEGAERGSSPTP